MLFMLANKQVFKFFTIFLFMVNAASLLLIALMFSCQCNLFWGYANGFVNIFNVLYDFSNTISFIRILYFTYSFVYVSVDISYKSNRNFSGLINKSKPGRNGCNKNAVLIFLFLTSPFFHFFIC